jgi:ATP-dependent protease ClpP protease subunit
MPKVANVLIYGDIQAHDPNESGRVTVGLNDVKAQLSRQGNPDIINVRVRTRGGEVDEGEAIYDYFQELAKSGKVVNTIGEGLVASIGTKILQSAGGGGTRSMERVSEFFIHNPWGSVQGEHKDVEAYALQLKEAEEGLLNFYISKTNGKADKDLLRSYMEKQTSLTPQQALELGFIDEIIEPKVYAHLKEKPNNSIETIIEQKMSGLKENIAKILALVTPTKVKAMQYKLEDGTEVFVDGELVEGTTVHIGVDATGELAPDGVHMIEGVNVTTEGGKITKIEEYVDVEALKAQVADLTAKLAEKESIEAKANEALELAEQAIEAKEAQIVALNTKIGSNYTPAPRQKQVLAKKQEPGERNRVEEAKERKAAYKQTPSQIK